MCTWQGFGAHSMAKKKRKEIIDNFDLIDYLPPGLYEMIIEGDIRSGDFIQRRYPMAASFGH